ncbi:hypothetical protein CVD25_06635 [Bacillus canaveralius]|uniref:Group-specific protein n=2 Tax=Bacillus TaxID=1386 RepID=A0A2N5GJ40_9BACI|nr:hypothetical protein [Bacillus canaveralius]PLR81074.1 hypothetical protein CU635_16320 [Bacillus canaveralius]PLR98952.1 hypothetical protein CVD25_06635 [Bacillus canaveralius]RSK49722.1 hypothetical protein EJA13_15355 [Bacillus canaveralius]
MFDPTAFENMKVVIEGAIYDKDLAGELKVIDRNDLINTAKLSREYSVSFTNPGSLPGDPSCTLILQASLKNLAAELLLESGSGQEAGCTILIVFNTTHKKDLAISGIIQEKVREIWGIERIITQRWTFGHESEDNVTNETIVSFNRPIFEEQIDDLVAMIDYMEKTIKSLQTSVL